MCSPSTRCFGHYRNDPAAHAHNFLTHDGTPPADLRAAARTDLAAYDTVRVREEAVEEVRPEGAGFAVDLADGTTVTARRVVLATGLRDTLPSTPGVAGLFGTVAAHCPYCHGHEFAGTHVAILGSAPHVSRIGLLVIRIADRVTVLTDGGTLEADTRHLLARAGIAVRPEPVTGACRSASGARVSFTEGPDEEVGGLFVTTSFGQAAPFAEQLGLRMLLSGCVEVDVVGRTSLPGVYAAGDLAHSAALPGPMASVLNAAAAGLMAATAVDMDRLTLDWDVPAPL